MKNVIGVIFIAVMVSFAGECAGIIKEITILRAENYVNVIIDVDVVGTKVFKLASDLNQSSTKAILATAIAAMNNGNRIRFTIPGSCGTQWQLIDQFTIERIQ